MRRPLILLALVILLLASSAAVTRYTLRRGDTLGGVARRLGVSVDALARANGIKNPDRVLPGQVLVVPPKNAPAPKMAPAVATKPAPAPAAAAMKPIADAHIVAARGTPVVAPVGGTLEEKQGAIGGNAFYVRGDDGNTYYGAHLDAYARGSGRIESGQQIGVVGDTGNAKGGATHLHFEFHPK